MKIYFSVILILICTFIGFGQTKPCNLTLKDSPKIHGIYLGMSVEEFKSIFPNTESLDNSFQEMNFYSYGYKNFDPMTFEGGKTVLEYIWFLDGKAESFGFHYPEFEPKSINDFVRQAAVMLNIPSTGWKYAFKNGNPQDLYCIDFSVSVGREEFRAGEGDPYVSLTDTNADKIIFLRRKQLKAAEIEEKQKKLREKQTFKP